MRFPPGFFDGIEIASGPGYHTDEASSALRHLASEGLPLADVALLYEVSRGDAVRSNPTDEEQAQSAADAESGVAQAAAPYKELVRLAYLATGQWGTETSTLRRHLPLVDARPNPAYPERIHSDFFVRMAMLERATLAMIVRADARYDAEKPPRPAAKRPWIRSLNKILTAVRFLRAQEKTPAKDRTIRSGQKDGKGGFFLGLPKGRAWGPLARDGNQKLPFVSYSELPMATCPGAGECGVSMGAYDVLGMKPVIEKGKAMLLQSGPNKGKPKLEEQRGGKRGWCYSFSAWRMDGPYTRQFLNTLANYADREFVILKNGGPADPRKYEARVEAAIRGEKDREWTHFIEQLALSQTKKARAAGKRQFIRLFVDGDINTEDNIYAWMRMCKRLEGQIEIYGYSKCWQQFMNVQDRFGTKFWPKNYVVNMSSGSVYVSARFADIRAKMEKLTISRGYFEAVNLDKYIKQLKVQTELLAKNPNAPIRMDAPKVKFEQFAFSEDRVRMFVRLNGLKTWEQAVVLVPTLAAGAKNASEDEIRKAAFHAWITELVRDPSFGAMVRRELAKDASKVKLEASYYDGIEKKQKNALRLLVTTGEAARGRLRRRELVKKALAVVLHEVLWTYGIGGSCPLVCGNCSDDPSDATKGVHRCAAKKGSPFWRADIHIGIH